MLSRDLEAVRTYVPQGATRSPKTGRILEGNRIYNGSFGTVWLFSIFMPVGRKRLEKRRRREGTLKEDNAF